MTRSGVPAYDPAMQALREVATAAKALVTQVAVTGATPSRTSPLMTRLGHAVGELTTAERGPAATERQVLRDAIDLLALQAPGDGTEEWSARHQNRIELFRMALADHEASGCNAHGGECFAVMQARKIIAGGQR